MSGDLINVNVCVKMKCCLPNKCQGIQFFFPLSLLAGNREEKKKHKTHQFTETFGHTEILEILESFLELVKNGGPQQGV